MHPQFRQASVLTHKVIGAAVEVHRELGPGLVESIYERCLLHEISRLGMAAESQRVIRVRFKDLEFEEWLRFDVLVADCLMVELKAVQELLPVHQAQLLSYMRLLNKPVGLLISFHEARLVEGVRRLILPGANLSDSAGAGERNS